MYWELLRAVWEVVGTPLLIAYWLWLIHGARVMRKSAAASLKEQRQRMATLHWSHRDLIEQYSQLLLKQTQLATDHRDLQNVMAALIRAEGDGFLACSNADIKQDGDKVRVERVPEGFVISLL